MTTNQTTGNNLLNLVLRAVNWSLIADNTATTPATSLYIALHTADPGATGNQTTNEIAYTSYGRVAIARTTGGWSAASAGASSPAANIVFPTGTGGSGTATFMSIGMLSSGAGTILWSGPISPSVVTGNGVTPTLTNATTLTIT